MERTQKLQQKLTAAQNDTTMSPVLRKQVCAYLVRTLERARAEQSVFDYEELIETARQDDVERKITLWPLASDNEYERQWAQSLHPWTVKVIGLFVMSQSVLWVIGIAAIAA